MKRSETTGVASS